MGTKYDSRDSDNTKVVNKQEMPVTQDKQREAKVKLNKIRGGG